MPKFKLLVDRSTVVTSKPDDRVLKFNELVKGDTLELTAERGKELVAAGVVEPASGSARSVAERGGQTEAPKGDSDAGGTGEPSGSGSSTLDGGNGAVTADDAAKAAAAQEAADAKAAAANAQRVEDASKSKTTGK